MHRIKLALVLSAVLLLPVAPAVAAPPPPGIWVLEIAPGLVPVAKPRISPLDASGSDQAPWQNNTTVWSASCAGESPTQAYSRLSVCTGVIGWSFTHYTRQGTAEVPDGAIAGVLTSYTSIPGFKTYWTHVVQIKPIVSWGVASVGTNYVTAQASCTVNCYEQFGTAQVPLVLNTWKVLTVGVASQAMKGSVIRKMRYSIDEVFDHVGAAEGSALSQGTLLPEIRCDNSVAQVGTEGCIFDGAWSALTYDRSSTAVGQVAIHISAAQATLSDHVGRLTNRLPSGSALHRTQSAAVQAGNTKAKTKACATVPQPPPTPVMECDEYPFRSSREGAGAGGIYSVKYVLKGQNRSAGGSLVAMFNAARSIDGDPFYVEIR